MDDPRSEDEDVELVELDAPGATPMQTLAKLSRGARKVLPGDSDFGDHLSTGGDHATQILGRRIAELSADRPSFLRELGLGTLQVYEALAAGSWDERGETELTVVFTDLVRFSGLGAAAGDSRATEMLRRVDSAVTSWSTASGRRCGREPITGCPGGWAATTSGST